MPCWTSVLSSWGVMLFANMTIRARFCWLSTERRCLLINSRGLSLTSIPGTAQAAGRRRSTARLRRRCRARAAAPPGRSGRAHLSATRAPPGSSRVLRGEAAPGRAAVRGRVGLGQTRPRARSPSAARPRERAGRLVELVGQRQDQGDPRGLVPGLTARMSRQMLSASPARSAGGTARLSPALPGCRPRTRA